MEFQGDVRKDSGVFGQLFLWRTSERAGPRRTRGRISGGWHLVVISTGEIPISRILRSGVFQVKPGEWSMIGGLTPGGLLGKDKVP